MPRFLWHALRSQAQARRAPGNLSLDVLNDTRFAFWTRSSWQDEASMRAFLLSGAHKKAMPTLAHMCDEAAIVHWEQEGGELPTWQEAHRRLVESGRPSRVRHPSVDQEARHIPAPRG
ncbi:MAG: DUF3291 domain-containing protein [Acidobacteriota bacterium]